MGLPTIMARFLVIVVSLAPAAAQTVPAPVTITAVRAAQAGNWQGQLEYRDYKADRWFGLPLKITMDLMRDGLTLIRHADFDDGPTTGIVTITSAALFDPATNREQSVSFRKGRESELTTSTLRLTRAEAIDRWTIVALQDGRDNDRPARIRETARRDGAMMVTLKEVDFLDDQGEAWLTRNRTTLTRQ